MTGRGLTPSQTVGPFFHGIVRDGANVLVTPHTAGFHVGYADEALPIVEENLRLFLAGDTANLINVVRR